MSKPPYVAKATPPAAPVVATVPAVQTQAAASTAKTNSGPAVPAKAARKLVPSPGDLPDGWGDTEKVVEWVEPTGDDFGAIEQPTASGNATEVQKPNTTRVAKAKA